MAETLTLVATVSALDPATRALLVTIYIVNMLGVYSIIIHNNPTTSVAMWVLTFLFSLFFGWIYMFYFMLRMVLSLFMGSRREPAFPTLGLPLADGERYWERRARGQAHLEAMRLTLSESKRSGREDAP